MFLLLKEKNGPEVAELAASGIGLSYYTKINDAVYDHFLIRLMGIVLREALSIVKSGENVKMNICFVVVSE